eukprot:Pgem_evm1s13204
MKLSPVKIELNSEATEKYVNQPGLIYNEVVKYFPSLSRNIKNQLSFGNVIKIITDDKQTHTNLLHWPTDAFSNGIIKVTNTATPKPISGFMYLSEAVNLEDRIYKDIAQKNNVTFTRITRGKERLPTKKVHIKFENEEQRKNLLTNGLKIGFQIINIHLNDRYLQCYRCQEIGHTAHNCKKDVKCLVCAGNHHHTDKEN